MDFKQRLSLQARLQQSLVMTPQLQQGIKLLQLNHLELVQEIQNEILENPTLEEVPGSTVEAAPEAERALQEQATAAAANDGAGGDGGPTREGEVDWNQVLEGMGQEGFRQRGASGMEELPPIETNLVASTSLAEHLEWQLQMQSCTDGEREVAGLIVQNLDHRGWLSLPLEDLVTEHGLDAEDAEGALDIVQHLDPLGCGSRDLVACLQVQAAILYPEDPVFPRIIAEHLGDIEKRNYLAIARALGIEVEDVLEYHRMLKTLEPWPGRNFGDAEPQYISPDVYVFKVGGEWQVGQNTDGMPRLRVSNYYRNVLLGKDSTREEREYIKERLSSAAFLIKSIDKRESTIRKVMLSILARQLDFFERGPEHLRPMILRDVAEEVGIHESTVSRVTSNKYVQCPQGIFELKYFFNNAVNAVHGEAVAAESVKLRIRRLIQGEDPSSPLSDDTIVQMLKRDNVDIARRTVAKYREAMGILPSSKRREVC
jgi:RNA polymerase sigma-54 factor